MHYGGFKREKKTKTRMNAKFAPQKGTQPKKTPKNPKNKKTNQKPQKSTDLIRANKASVGLFFN
jgi:hypothetical protein